MTAGAADLRLCFGLLTQSTGLCHAASVRRRCGLSLYRDVRGRAPAASLSEDKNNIQNLLSANGRL